MLFQAAVGIWAGMAMNGAWGLVSTRVAPGAGLGGTGGQWREAHVQHGAAAALARTMWGAGYFCEGASPLWPLVLSHHRAWGTRNVHHLG